MEWGGKNNDMNSYLAIFSYIVDIRPGPLMNEIKLV